MEREKQKQKVRSSMCWLTSKMTAATGIGIGHCWEPGARALSKTPF